MTRNDARLIAEELYKIQKREGLVETEVIGIDDVAQILGMSKQSVYNRIEEIPHSKFGKALRFFKSDIIKLLRR
jgi:predicted DNA-binding transcriptional regulator AlpA